MLRRIFLGLMLVVGAFGLPLTAQASQNTACQPTTGTVSGLQLTNNLNAALTSIISSNSGSSAPATDCTGVPLLGQWWIDTSSSPNKVKLYDGSSWQLMGAMDASTHVWNPVVGGGVGTVVAAATTDLCSVTQGFVAITGTTGITSFGTTCTAGQIKFLSFSGSTTLTYNATSLILPGGSSITTQAGDTAIAVRASGSGNWVVVNYTQVSGRTLVNPVATTSTTGVVKIGTGLSVAGDGTVTNSGSVALASAQSLVVTNNATTPNTQIDVTVSSAVLTTSTGTPLFYSGGTNTCDLTTSGVAGGLDAGSKTVSTWYRIYLIYNVSSSTPACLASTSTTPSLPSGYTYSFYAGSVYVYSDGNLRRTIQRGRDVQYQMVSGSANSTTIPGYSTGGSVTYWSGISITGFIPPTATRVRGWVWDYSGGANAGVTTNSMSGTDNSSNGAPVYVNNGNSATFPSNAMFDFLIEGSRTVYFGGYGGFNILGWSDSVNAS